MADYAPPANPPPPKVPEGWKAIWNTQYSEYFYVNIYTKQSQWDKPTEPVYPPGEAPPDAPPNYAPSGTESRPSMEKKNLGAPGLGSNNPYAASSGKASPAPDISEDERLARQLQEEEDARARGQPSRGAADDFYAQGTPQPNAYGQPGQYGQPGIDASPYPQSQNPYGTPPLQDKGKSKGGFLGKLLGKASGGSKPHGYPQQPGPYYGGQPGYGQPGYGQSGYYPPQQGMMNRPHKKPGMGAGGAAALGVGGGLLGGALLGSALADAGDGGNTYIENDYGDGGGDFGGDGGGDFGGGDFGGGGF